MNASEIKRLSGAKSKAAGASILYAQLEQKTWERNGRTYSLAGYDQRKDLVHFTATWSIEGGVGHRRVGIALADALGSITGDLSAAIVLF